MRCSTAGMSAVLNGVMIILRSLVEVVRWRGTAPRGRSRRAVTRASPLTRTGPERRLNGTGGRCWPGSRPRVAARNLGCCGVSWRLRSAPCQRSGTRPDGGRFGCRPGPRLQWPFVSAARARRRRPRRPVTAVAAAVLLVAVVIVVGYLLHGRGGLGGSPGGGTPAADALRATANTGHVTGLAPTDCRQRTAADGQPLPDPGCTPGVVSTAVTQTTLDATICRPGYTRTVRAPESETEPFKKKIMTVYREPGPLADYELDHLVSLELGGSNDAGNLWPEHNDHPAGAINSKDLVENALNKAVCSHTVTLAAAQTAIATDWTTALATLGLPALR